MIRTAVFEDLTQIADLVRASFVPRLHDYMVYAQHGVSHFLSAQISMPMTGSPRHFLVEADDQGKVQAFAEFQEGEGNTAFLSYICVADGARGRGLATGLINHFLSTTPRPVSALQLDVFAENQPARALYGKLGFVAIGSTGWFVRDLPPAYKAAVLRSANGVEAAAMFARYGFCRHQLEWNGTDILLGQIGPRTIRCFRIADFMNDALLGTAHRWFPEAQSALYICPMEAPDRPDDRLIFHSSLRLVRHYNRES